jgi:hypothetical protein
MPSIANGCEIIPIEELSALVGEPLVIRPDGMAALGVDEPQSVFGQWTSNGVGSVDTVCDYLVDGTSGDGQRLRVLVSQTFDTRDGAGAFYAFKRDVEYREYLGPRTDLTLPNTDAAFMLADSTAQAVFVWCDSRVLSFGPLGMSGSEYAPGTLEAVALRLATDHCPPGYIAGAPVPPPIDPLTTTTPPTTSSPVTPAAAPAGNQVATIIDEIGAASPMTCDELSNRLTSDGCTDIDQAFFNRLVIERPAAFNDFYGSGVIEVAHNDEPLWLAALGFQACKAYQSGAGLSDFVNLLDAEMVGYTSDEAAQIYDFAVSRLCPTPESAPAADAPNPPSAPVTDPAVRVEPLVDLAQGPCEVQTSVVLGIDAQGTLWLCSGSGERWPLEFEGAIEYFDDERYPLRLGQHGAQVQFVQGLLAHLGYDVGPSGADGYFGASTYLAVVEWQFRSGRPVTEVVTVEDMEAMRAQVVAGR